MLNVDITGDFIAGRGHDGRWKSGETGLWYGHTAIHAAPEPPLQVKADRSIGR